jgi:hypothetical protein
VGIELSRAAYEAGEWAGAVEEAWIKGQKQKSVHNEHISTRCTGRTQQGKEMARRVTEWVEEWWRTNTSG